MAEFRFCHIFNQFIVNNRQNRNSTILNPINMTLLEVEDVVKQYADHLALDSVSLSVPENTIYGLLGQMVQVKPP